MVDALEKINDGQFVCNFCVQRGLPRLKWVKQLLSVGKGKVKHCMGTEASKNLLLTLKMFFTFEQVFPEPTIQDWVQFESDENTMFLQCLWFLKKVSSKFIIVRMCLDMLLRLIYDFYKLGRF